LSRLWHDESGQDMVEYALITLAMGLGTVAGVHGLASSIDNDLTTVLNAFNVATAAAH
jgi:Flp pilus assembly pilin Flp